jgi:hypothetical protein
MNMPNLIEIEYQHHSQGRSVVELIDLLSLVAPDKHQLVWSILDLEAIGDVSTIWERGILDLEENIRDLPQGLILSWQMLVLLASKFDQVINAVIVGCQEATQIPTLSANNDLYIPCAIALELIDSSVWRIYAKDERLLQHFHQEFSGVKKMAPIKLPQNLVFEEEQVVC